MSNSNIYPMTDFEEYMLLDGTVAYPMECHGRFCFSGGLSRREAESVLEKVLACHPFLYARCVKIGEFRYAFEVPDFNGKETEKKRIFPNFSQILGVRVHWLSGECRTAYPREVREPLDHFAEAMLRIFFLEEKNSDGQVVRTDMILKWHHSASDGRGILRFVADFLQGLACRAESNAEGNAKGNAESNAKGNAEGRAESNAKGNAEGRAESNAKGNAEGRAESNAKGNAEGRAESNAEGNAKGNAESNAKGNAEGRAESNAKGNAEGNAESNAKGNAEGNAESNAKGNAEGRAESNAKGNAEGNAESNAKGNAEGRAESNAKGNAESNAEGNAKGNAESNAKGNAEGNAESNAKSNAEGNAESNAKGNAKGNAKSRAVCAPSGPSLPPIDLSGLSKRDRLGYSWFARNFFRFVVCPLHSYRAFNLVFRPIQTLVQEKGSAERPTSPASQISPAKKSRFGRKKADPLQDSQAESQKDSQDVSQAASQTGSQAASPDDQSRRPVDFPSILSQKLSRDEVRSLLATCRDRGFTFNDALLLAVWNGTRSWQRDHSEQSGVCDDASKRWIRISVPFDLRRPQLSAMPAMNIVSMLFLDRRNNQIDFSTRFMNGIRREMQYAKKFRLGAGLLVYLKDARVIWGNLHHAVKLCDCWATLVMTNLGRLFTPEEIALPRTKDGKIQIHDLVLDEIDVVSPIRSQTNVSIGCCTYAGEMKFSIIYDTTLMTREDAFSYLEEILSKLRRLLAPENPMSPVPT